MRILNATRRTISVMNDRNELIAISPGELSTLFIGSKSTIMAAIKLGSPSEIGIILGSEYELDMARTISVALPYIHMSEEAAIAKLIDKNVDYKKSEVTKLSESAKLMVAQKDEEIQGLKSKLEEVVKEFEDYKSNLIPSKTKVEEDFKTELRTKSEVIHKLESQIQSNEFSAKLLEEDNSKLSKEIDLKDNEINNLKSSIKELEKSSEGSTGTIEELKSIIEAMTTDADSMKSRVEAMKNDFNTACIKFNLSKDDEGNWIQLESDEVTGDPELGNDPE